MKKLILYIIKIYWFSKTRLNFWLFGGYGVCNQIKTAPFPYIQPLLKKYGATIGKKCVIDTGVTIHRPDEKNPFKNLIIGDNVYIGHNCIIDLTKKVIIGNNIAISSTCQLWTHATEFSRDLRDPDDYFEITGEIRLNGNSVLYAGVIVTGNVEIGFNTRIGAGSFINKNVEDNSFYAGIPAKKIKIRETL